MPIFTITNVVGSSKILPLVTHNLYVIYTWNRICFASSVANR